MPRTDIAALSERNQVRDGIAAFLAKYGPDSRYAKPEACAALRKLDPETATARDLIGIIGNDTWAYPLRCEQCDERSWQTVALGENIEYESSKAVVCRACLLAALRVLDAAYPPTPTPTVPDHHAELMTWNCLDISPQIPSD